MAGSPSRSSLALPTENPDGQETSSLMIILFLHGWQSILDGVKPTYLKDHGHVVINPKFDDGFRTAQAEYDLHQPDEIVGSSRGAVAMNDAISVLPQFNTDVYSIADIVFV